MKLKNKVIILVTICLVVLIGAFVADKLMNKSYLNKIGYDEIIEKVDNKESFILLVSQTTCSHCMSYKPKLDKVAKEYKVNIYYIDVDLLKEDEFNALEEKIHFEDAGTPVTLFIKNGQESSAATRINGDASSEKIVKKLKSNGFLK